jgi:hypothetical protein
MGIYTRIASGDGLEMRKEENENAPEVYFRGVAGFSKN